jgi:hypothetical protein
MAAANRKIGLGVTDGAEDEAKRWRQLAEETRAVATFIRSDNARRLLQTIATKYDRLAALAERRAGRILGRVD